MTNTFSVAAQVLEQWGARVTPIPTSQKDESDWLAEFGSYRVLRVPGNRQKATAEDNTVSASTIKGGYVFAGRMEMSLM